MILEVLNGPHLKAASTCDNKVLVSFDPATNTTTVDCNVDIVTLGLAVNILQQQYDNYLKELNPDLALSILKTTRMAIYSEKY